MTPEFIRDALDDIATRDADLAAALQEYGYPAPRIREPGFGSLINIIIGQQVSVHAAAAIRGRLETAVNPLTPETFLAAGDDTIRAVGFSNRKVEYGKGLAEAILNGTLETQRLAGLDDDDVTKVLTSIRGLGRWSADIYMLFALGRADAWPLDDLAIQVAVKKLKRMRKRPDRKRMEAVAKRWRPYRGVAALFLWHYYKGAPSLADK
ncbi:MAG: DNA-3-methyladenine glycosylase family protein [Alphaproteobacteria bacterium]